MKKVKRIIWGLVLVALGILYGLNELNILPFELFFNGWWTLFIIVPCFFGLFRKDGAKVGYLIGIAIGIFLLLMAQDVLAGEKLWALLIAAVCVLIGVNLIFPKKKQENSFGTQS